MSNVASRYGLSDVGLKKLCSRLQIPTPPRGYWAKLRAGKPVIPTPTLRDYKGPPKHLLKPPSASPSEGSSKAVDPRLQAVLDHEADPSHRILVGKALRSAHPLVARTRAALADAQLDQRGFPSARGDVLDIRVSKGMQARALRVADALIRALERRGHPVSIGKSGTRIDLLGVQLGVVLYEPTRRLKYEPKEQELKKRERNQWVHIPEWHYQPTGKLQVIVDSGFGGRISDQKKLLVEDQLNQLICHMARRAVTLLVGWEQQARARAQYDQKRAAALEMKATQDAERKRLQGLVKEARQWERAGLLRRYLDAVEADARRHGPLTAGHIEKLRWGRAKADWLDPLTSTTDELLDRVIEIPSRYFW